MRFIRLIAVLKVVILQYEIKGSNFLHFSALFSAELWADDSASE